MSKVYIRKAKSYGALAELLESMGVNPAGKKVFIKPNIVIPVSPDSAVITHPEAVRSLIRYLKGKKAAEIVIGELPGLGVDVDEMYLVSGYKKMAEEEGVKLLNLNLAGKTEIKWAYGNILVPNVVLDSYYIDFAKMKTHMQTRVTLCVKNQKGIIFDEDKKNFHRRGLHRPLAEFVLVFKPALSIIDGITALEGDGPLTTGKKVEAGVLVASTDPVAADSAACRIMGFSTGEIEHLVISGELNAGDIDPEIYGDSIESCRIEFKRPNEVCFKLFKIVSWRNPYACSMCGDAVRAAIKKIILSPRYWLKGLPLMFYFTFIKGIDFVMGSEARYPAYSGRRLVCLGNCSSKDGKSSGKDGIMVLGCPPSAEDIIKYIFS